MAITPTPPTEPTAAPTEPTTTAQTQPPEPKKARDIMGIDLKRIEKQAQQTSTKNSPNKDEPTPIPTAGQWLPQNNYGFEQIQGRQYLTSTNQLTTRIEDTADSQHVAYTPIVPRQIGWQLCTNTPAQYEKTQLWTDIKQYIHSHVDLPEPQLYDVLTAWVLANWIPELWDTVPYIFFYGPMATGKTRSLSTLQYISYRANFSICCSPAALFRSIEKYNVTPFLDEAEVYNKEDARDIIACLNAGNKRESGYIQRVNNETGEIILFHVFGFKVIAGTAKLRSTLESRSIIVRMEKNTRDVNRFINKTDAQTLRDQLLQWRFWALQHLTIPRTEESLLQALPQEFKDMHNDRVLELFLPLYFVADDTIKPVIVEYAQIVYEDHKDEESTSDDAEIVAAMWNNRDQVKNGILELKDLFNAINAERNPAEQYKYTKQVGKLVGKLGFRKKLVGRSRRTGIVWNQEKLERLKLRYLPPPPPPETNETEETNKQPEKDTHNFPANDQIASCTVLPPLPDEQGNCRKFKWLCKRCGNITDLLYHTQFFNKNNKPADICNPCASQILEYLQKKEENRYE
jgi:hypothetical protein